MEPVFLGLVAVGIVSSALSLTSSASEGLIAEDASPIFGVTIPQGYRQWELIAPAEEANPLNELRAVLGNAAAIKAYQGGVLPFPDGSILVKLAWRRAQSPEFAPASIPGAASTVQIMVKDLQRYSATGGWGFAHLTRPGGLRRS
jgi:hypothetical protein